MSESGESTNGGLQRLQDAHDKVKVLGFLDVDDLLDNNVFRDVFLPVERQVKEIIQELSEIKVFDKFKVDIGEIKDGARIGDDIEKHISLKYHLEQRNVFANEISYKTKLGKNRFLFGNDDFGSLEKGTN